MHVRVGGEKGRIGRGKGRQVREPARVRGQTVLSAYSGNGQESPAWSEKFKVRGGGSEAGAGSGPPFPTRRSLTKEVGLPPYQVQGIPLPNMAPAAFKRAGRLCLTFPNFEAGPKTLV